MNSNIWNFVVPSGQTVKIPQAGTRFDFLIMTSSVAVRSSDGKKFGAYNAWIAGLGQKNLSFTGLEFQNTSPFPAAVSVVIGDDNLVNNLTIPIATQTQDVTYPTQSVSTGSAGNIQIPDLSGSIFLDINQKVWIALFRRSIIISNTSSSLLTLQKFGATTGSANCVLAIPSGLPIAHNSSGDFTISVGGAGISAIVSEIYSAIPSTLT